MSGSYQRYASTIMLATFLVVLLIASPVLADPLPSWSQGATKERIIDFVKRVTDPGSGDYVTPENRIAVFDNDGTLWAEQPVYFQFLFAIDRLKAMAAKDPSVLKSDVLKAAANGDMKTVAASGEKGLLEIIVTTHSNLTVDEFQADVRKWLGSAKHPDKGVPYTDLVYQPMLELLSYLRDQGFMTYIVSGGGIDFLRVFSKDAYNIPVQQVIGSSGKSSFQDADGTPVIMKNPGVFFIDDKAGKPVAIESRIGKRPIFAAGNSDGDFQMLEWTTSGTGPRLGLIVHHTDAKREWAYDRKSHVGTLDRGLDEAGKRGWLLVDMAKDWARVWPKEK